MYIVRESFTAKPGKASSLAKLFKEVMALADLKTRVLTDFVADFNTVVLETETDDLAAFDRTMADYAARADIREKMKGYTDMYITGRREIFRVV
jgi:hypothetical protein